MCLGSEWAVGMVVYAHNVESTFVWDLCVQYRVYDCEIYLCENVCVHVHTCMCVCDVYAASV